MTPELKEISALDLNEVAGGGFRSASYAALTGLSLVMGSPVARPDTPLMEKQGYSQIWK